MLIHAILPKSSEEWPYVWRTFCGNIEIGRGYRGTYMDVTCEDCAREFLAAQLGQVSDSALLAQI